ncbi:MAG: YdcF family protein [Acidimicrobiales bacterium]
MKRRRLVIRLALAFGAVALVIAAVTAHYFVWPALGTPTPADAVVVLGGPGDRYNTGARLVRQGLAPVMVASSDRDSGSCPGTMNDVAIICFTPDPYSTRGEARYVADLAREKGWTHVILVTSVGQASRAQLRLERCFPGDIDVVAVRPVGLRVVRDAIYEWGANFKALVLERGC